MLQFGDLLCKTAQLTGALKLYIYRMQLRKLLGKPAERLKGTQSVKISDLNMIISAVQATW